MLRYLYVMLSRTDTYMGRFIRFCTKGQYNHVSLSVDDDLQSFVSFARYHRDVPLAGGAIAEPLDRLFSCGKVLPVRIYKLEISLNKARQIEDLFAQLKHSRLIYNTPGALVTGCHMHCSVPGAYTCLEFAEAIFGKKFKSIDALGSELEPWMYYEGDLYGLLQAGGDQSDPYFQKRGFWKGTWDTMVHFKTLTWRSLRLERPYDPVFGCHINIWEYITNQKSDTEKQLTFPEKEAIIV